MKEAGDDQVDGVEQSLAPQNQLEHDHLFFLTHTRTGRVGLTPKWVRLAPKWDKSGAFSDQISVEPNLPSL